MKKLLIATLAGCVIAAGLQGCAALVVGGAATGAVIAHDRRSFGTVIDDQEIEFRAWQALRAHQRLYDQSHIGVTSYDRIVLLTGETPTPEMRAEAGKIVGQIANVRRVYNQLAIAAPDSLATRISDAGVTARVKVSLFDVPGLKHFDPTRVKVVTEEGVVYLMGLLTHKEATAVTNEVRHIDGVQRVVTVFEYIDSAPPAQEQENAAAGNNTGSSTSNTVQTYPVQQ